MNHAREREREGDKIKKEKKEKKIQRFAFEKNRNIFTRALEHKYLETILISNVDKSIHR